jgi:methylthioxylose transferase
MEATAGQISAGVGARGAGRVVPLAGAALAAGTVAYGLLATASGAELGTPLPPFLSDWAPRAGPLALPAAALLAAGVLLAPRLRALTISPARFAAAAFALGLALRVALATARDGVPGLYAVYELPNFEAASEYLPALPALDLGVRLFLDTFAEVGTSLPVHVVGHPPGLLLALHWLGIDTAEGMAALTIGAGALSVPLAYLLARSLLDEGRARTATLLYVFAPSALLYGATSADALYATVALLAAVPLVARRSAIRGLGPPAFAVASFFSYANLAVGAWAAIVAASRDGLARAAALAAGCAVVLAAFYGLLHLATGYDPLGVLRATEAVYREGIASSRPYAFWLFGSPAAFLVALGLPTAWFALRAAGEGFAPALALVVVIALAAVLGFTKAETERIYLFLVPLACVAAAAALPERRLPATLCALGAQALASELLLETIW